MVASVQIEHFAPGTVILQQAGAPATHLFVVRRGAAEIVDGGRVIDEIGEGDVFGMWSLLGQVAPTATVRAGEDTLCYLIDAEVANAVLRSGGGIAFVAASVRRRIAQIDESRKGGGRPRPLPAGGRPRPADARHLRPRDAGRRRRPADGERTSLEPAGPERLRRRRRHPDRPRPADARGGGTPERRHAGPRGDDLASRDRPARHDGRRGPAADARGRVPPLPDRGGGRLRPRRGDRHRPDGDRPRHAVRAQELDRARARPRGGRDRGRRASSRGLDAGELERGPGRRGPRDRVLDRRRDAPAARARDGRARGAAVPVDLARPGERGPSGAGDPNRPGPRARVRGRPRRRGRVVGPARRVRHRRARGRRDHPAARAT